MTTYCEICTAPFGYVFNGVCFEGCPPGTTEPEEGVVCQPCPTGCNKCDNKNPDNCIDCAPPLVVYNGTCVPACPPKFIVNKEKTACVEWTIDDWPLIWFPFICAALISILTIILGKCKKKKNEFNVKNKIEQKTVTVVICAISPLQWLAIIGQAVLAGIYGTMTFCYLSAAVFIAFCILNMVFEIFFD